MGHIQGDRVRLVLAASTATIAAFQIGLAAGAPWGALAWGGSHPGTLPSSLRAASAGAALTWGAVTWAVARMDLPPTVASRPWLMSLSAIGGIGTLLNLISPSGAERIWAPVSLVVALCAWRLPRVPAAETAGPRP